VAIIGVALTRRAEDPGGDHGGPGTRPALREHFGGREVAIHGECRRRGMTVNVPPSPAGSAAARPIGGDGGSGGSGSQLGFRGRGGGPAAEVLVQVVCAGGPMRLGCPISARGLSAAAAGSAAASA